MKKSDLVAKIAEKADITKTDADAALVALAEVVSEGLKADEKIAIPGLGTFAVKERAARTGRNPHTGETIEIAAAKVPSFKVSPGNIILLCSTIDLATLILVP